MKRQIFDFYSPCVIGGARRDRAWRSGTRRSYRRIVLSIFVAFLLTAALVFGLILYAPFNTRLKKADYYMLFLSQENTVVAAEAAKQQISTAGGAGYIINDGDFLVAAFVYAGSTDAQNVRERMLPDYPAARVERFAFGKTKVRRWGNRADEKRLKALLDYPLRLADTAIDFAIALDSFRATESGVMQELEGLSESLEQKWEQAAQLSAAYPPVKAASLASGFYADIMGSLVGIMAEGQPQNKLTHRLKSFACEVVHKSFSLRNKLELL